MATFDDLLEKTVDEGRLPGVVLLARDRDGKLDYAKAYGRRSIEPGSDQPVQLDTVFRLASSSKLLTTIAVLQAVERGLISLDDDALPHLPGLARQEVLTGFTWYGKPHTRPRAKPITVRHLLTQTAGTGYDFLTIQPIWRYRWWHKEAIGRGERIDQRLGYPLLHEAGEGWTYGSGVTWAGRVLEKVSGMTLEAWMRRYISEPLGLTSLTFFPLESDAIASRMAGVGKRDAWSGKVVHFPEPDDPVKDCLGGEGLHASLQDFMAVLHSLLIDDEKLLSKKTTSMMFTPQLSDVERPELRDCLGKPVWICNSILKKDEYDWGIGGVLVDGDGHEYLKRGTLMWSGLYHVLWWVDRQTGVCGVFGTQVVPGTDKIAVPMIGAFQREVYDRMNRERRQAEWTTENGTVNGDAASGKATSKPGQAVSSPTNGVFGWASSLWRN